jgi:xanthosine utilization system XapX-like protein
MESQLESPSFSTLVTAPWFIAVVGVLGIAIAYGMARTRRQTERERAAAAQRGVEEAAARDHSPDGP